MIKESRLTVVVVVAGAVGCKSTRMIGSGIVACLLSAAGGQRGSR